MSGSYYLHDESYRGPQANNEWRGIVVKNQVLNGNYDIMELSMSYLCRKYEGVELDKFLKKYPNLMM